MSVLRPCNLSALALPVASCVSDGPPTEASLGCGAVLGRMQCVRCGFQWCSARFLRLGQAARSAIEADTAGRARAPRQGKGTRGPQQDTQRLWKISSSWLAHGRLTPLNSCVSIATSSLCLDFHRGCARGTCTYPGLSFYPILDGTQFDSSPSIVIRMCEFR